MTTSQDDRDEDARFEALLRRSSLGAPGARQLRERIPLARKLLVAYDVEGYAGLDGRLAREVQQRVAGMLASAFSEAQVAPGAYEMQGQGDGGLALLSAGDGVDCPRVVSSLIGALESGLRRVNEELTPGARIRLRIAIDQASVFQVAIGYAGPSVVAVCRLRDAAAVRDMLRDSAGQLVVVVTDHLYRDILAHAPGRTFVRAGVTTREKEFAASAWAYLPGASLPAVAFDPELPEDVRRLLADESQAHLIPFRDTPPQGDTASGIRMAGVSREKRRKASAAARFHRRYVVPRTDLDPESTQVWNRAITASDQIGASDVVRQQLIDSVPVVAVLPYRLWEIAERLARLTMVRSAQRELLHGTDPDHPDLAPAVHRQRRAQELASADIEKRVRTLEVLADRIREADGAKRRETAARRLCDLDSSHLDLLSGLDADVAGPDMTERVIDDINTLIEQSRRAIQEANEAARSLILPNDQVSG